MNWLTRVSFLCLLVVITTVAAWIALSLQTLALSPSSIRLSSLKANSSPLPILVQFTPEVITVEDQFQLTIPAGWQFSGSASNYTVSTAFLPSGTVPAPGISTATNVSGQTVTFPLSDVTPGIQYGFFLTNGVTSTPTTVPTAEQVWQIALLSSGSVTESRSITTPITANDQISITARVGPAAEDFSVALTPSTTAELSQDEEITYTLEYASNYPDATPLTVQASWSLGTIGSSGIPSVEIAEYVPGSASDASGGIAPVIDLVNRTITWDIPSITPAAGTQSVQFTLKMQDTYTGSQAVSFEVDAAVTQPSMTVPAVVTHTYRYDAPPPPPTPTPTPSVSTTTSKKSCNEQCSDNTECATNYCEMSVQKCRDRDNPGAINCTTVVPLPSPTVELTPITLKNMRTVEISTSAISFAAEYSEPVLVTVEYGTAPDKLSQKLVTAEMSSLQVITLTGLDPSSVYYFRLQARTSTGLTTTSDIYLFSTAQKYIQGIKNMSLVFAHQGLPLSNATATATSLAVMSSVVVPRNVPYELVTTLPSEVIVKRIMLSIVSTNENRIKAATQIPLAPVGDGTYIARLDTFIGVGWYDLSLDVEDMFGNKLVWKIGEISVVDPLSIVDKASKQPIENASVVIERWNDSLQLFQELDPQSYGLSNEFKSDFDGLVPLVLSFGRYRVTSHSPRYQETSIEFELSNEKQNAYPVVFMAKRQFSLAGFTDYYQNAIDRVLSEIEQVTNLLKRSRTLYHLTSIITLLFLSGLSILSLQARTSLTLKQLKKYLHTHVMASFKKYEKPEFFIGRVLDGATHSPIARAEVTFLDGNNSVLQKVETMRNGFFRVKYPEGTAQIDVTAVGYKRNEARVSSILDEAGYLFTLSKQEGVSTAMNLFRLAVEYTLGALFEVFLFFSLLAQWMFVDSFPWYEVVPFILIAIFNILIWSHYTASHLLLPSKRLVPLKS